MKWKEVSTQPIGQGAEKSSVEWAVTEWTSLSPPSAKKAQGPLGGVWGEGCEEQRVERTGVKTASVGQGRTTVLINSQQSCGHLHTIRVAGITAQRAHEPLSEKLLTAAGSWRRDSHLSYGCHLWYSDHDPVAYTQECVGHINWTPWVIFKRGYELGGHGRDGWI